MYRYKALAIKKNKSITYLLILRTTEAMNYFMFDILLRFDKEQKRKLLPFRNKTYFNIEIKDELVSNMMDVISRQENKEFYFKRYYIRGKDIRNKVFNQIDDFIDVLEPDKLCVHIFTTKSALSIPDGNKLREHLPFEKEDSPIIFSFYGDESKPAAYMDLIGIKGSKK